ncbi:hypothetical protein F0L17_26545 [Streptomyces sp. TRM43335]|uniref:40-residue YVTN family beta-propeller repeat-containing protein n=1 Tax=Streptomyces taklimakanensis TaxID=2569853 RepID=A0A6G2BK15_9ACTN|nr:hypothetical protein [Streptomyces taklimakanensis]MTE22590.1 hypothetical protein [Streptomyces taklimakanensis]
MRIRRVAHRTTTVAVALAAALGLATPAAADTTATLPTTSFGDIAVDDTHRKVFVTDPDDGSIIVTDFEGSVLAEIPNQPGARGMTLTSDDSTLYVALQDSDGIAVIDTATHSIREHYHTGSGTGPARVALTAGKLWFSYGDDGWGDIGSIDLPVADADHPAVTRGLAGDFRWYYPPLLEVSPNAPGTLVAGEPSLSITTVGVYDVAGGTPVEKAWAQDLGEDGSGNLQDMALSADGTETILASGAPYHHHAYKVADLSPTTIYNTDTYPNSVAVAPDGTIAAGTSSAYEPDIWLFEPGVSEPYRTIDFPTVPAPYNSYHTPELVDGGLAWSEDQSRLFAVVEVAYSKPLELRVLNNPET